VHEIAEKRKKPVRSGFPKLVVGVLIDICAVCLYFGGVLPEGTMKSRNQTVFELIQQILGVSDINSETDLAALVE